jgi:hypothetical protein
LTPDVGSVYKASHEDETYLGAWDEESKWVLYAVTFLIFSAFLPVPSYTQQTLGSIDGDNR